MGKTSPAPLKVFFPNFYTWWKKASHAHKFSLISMFLIAFFILPLSLSTMSKEISFPRATFTDYELQDGATTKTPNAPPQLHLPSGKKFTCTLKSPCDISLVASDPDQQDSLSMDVAFLPPDLTLGNCQTAPDLLGKKRLTCSLKGSPQKTGVFKIMVTAYDGTGNLASQVAQLTIE
jgi:hypothetical protein